MPTGLYSRCYRTDMTVSFYINKSMTRHGIYKLLSEKEISSKEAFQLIKSGAYCGNIGLRRELGIETL
jgi:hypothetical protein